MGRSRRAAAFVSGNLVSPSAWVVAYARATSWEPENTGASRFAAAYALSNENCQRKCGLIKALEEELKHLLIEVLNLEDVSVEQIDSDAPLFGEGLGLDSIDALEFGVAIRRKYDVQMEVDSEKTREHFASIANLARFIDGSR